MYDIVTEWANDCQYSMYFWIELKSISLDKIDGKYVSVVFIRFVECFFRIFISQPLKIGTVWSTEFHFRKSNQRSYNEKNLDGTEIGLIIWLNLVGSALLLMLGNALSAAGSIEIFFLLLRGNDMLLVLLGIPSTDSWNAIKCVVWIESPPFWDSILTSKLSVQKKLEWFHLPQAKLGKYFSLSLEWKSTLRLLFRFHSFCCSLGNGPIYLR